MPRVRLSKPLLTRLQSAMIVPNVMDITGPMSGDTNMAATMFEALFSTSPSAARELGLIRKINSGCCGSGVILQSKNGYYGKWYIRV